MEEQQVKDFAKALEEGLMVRLVGDNIIMAMPLSDEDYERAKRGTLIEKVPHPLTAEEIEADIVHYILTWMHSPWESEEYRKPGIPTFACFEKRYGRPGRGGVDLNLTGNENVLLWSGLSPELASAIINLISRGAVHWHPCLPIYYMDEGRRPLPYPLAVYPVKESYTTKHWLPVEFALGHSCDRLLCPSQYIS